MSPTGGSSTSSAQPQRPSHIHGCPGCQKTWQCHNPTCSDVLVQWCRKWCAKCPPEIEGLEKLQALGHRINTLIQAAELKDARKLLERARSKVLDHVLDMYMHWTVDAPFAKALKNGGEA